MYYIVLEIYIGRRFLNDGCYLQQIISVVAKEALIITPNQIKKCKIHLSFNWTAAFASHKHKQ